MSVTSTWAACMQEVWPDLSPGFVCLKTSKVQPVCLLTGCDFPWFSYICQCQQKPLSPPLPSLLL